MEYEERIDSKQGTYIVASGVDFEDILEKKPLVLDSIIVNPGDLTTLHDWFTIPVEYKGFLKNAAIFYLGEGDSDLFESGGFYYDVTYIIDSNRIGKCYRKGSFRDFFLKQKNDKYFWK